MKSVSLKVTKDRIIIYPECRNKQGLRAASPPFVLVDPAIPPAALGKLVRKVLRASSLDQDNPGYVDRGDGLLEVAGVTSWAALRRKAGSGGIEDNDTGTLEFEPLKPDGPGYSGVPGARVRIPLDSPDEAVGKAFLSLVKKARKYAGLNVAAK